MAALNERYDQPLSHASSPAATKLTSGVNAGKLLLAWLLPVMLKLASFVEFLASRITLALQPG
jgi:hypothetical protein